MWLDAKGIEYVDIFFPGVILEHQPKQGIVK